MRRLLGVLIALLFTGFITNTYGQGFTDYNWYFGSDNKGVVFQKSDNFGFITNGLPSLGLASSAVATDPYDGEVLFYTDGIKIYNHEDNSMFGGDLLPIADANPSLNQTVAICIDPQDNNQYYIFTRKNDGTVVYAKVNMTGDNIIFGRPPLGAVTSTNNAIGLFSNTSPAIKIIPNSAQNGFLLIAHQSTTGDYLVQPITNTGLDAPVSIPVPGTLISTVGSLSYDPISDRFGVTSTVNGESAEIINLTATTSLVIPSTAFPGEINYDTEWSLDGNYLYISRNGGGGTGNIIQYDVMAASTTGNVLTAPVTESFGMMTAPDSAIYHLYSNGGQTLVGRIVNPKEDVSLISYNAAMFGQTFNAEQFPAFLPHYRVDFAISITPTATCLNVKTIFNVELTNTNTGQSLTIDQASWDFDSDAIEDSDKIVSIYEYTDDTNLSPTLDIVITSGGQTYSPPVAPVINLTDFDVMITGQHVKDTIVCPDQLPLNPITADVQSQSGATPVIKWSNNTSTGATTTIAKAGEYYITATVGNCVAYRTMRVTLHSPDPIPAAEAVPQYWYFGDRATLEFLGTANPTAIPLTPLNQIDTDEGCAVYTNGLGVVLFSTDGETVYDRNGDVIGSDIGGSQDATQSSLIIPTGDETIFYIFTTQEVFDTDGNSEYECRYSVFDLKLNNGIGDMQVTNKHLFNASSERLSGYFDPQAGNGWLLTHEYGTNTFKAFFVNEEGVSAPVISDLSTPHNRSTDVTGHGQMKVSNIDEITGDARVAIALSLSNNENYVEFFDFDIQTGAVFNPTQLFLETGQVYGVEFSPSSDILFASINDGGVGKIFRWEIDTTTAQGYMTEPLHILSSRIEVPEVSGISGEYGSLQLGPDGSIYVAVNNSATIGMINSPNSTFTHGVFPDLTYFWNIDNFEITQGLAGQSSRLGLPNYANGTVSNGGVTGSISAPESVCMRASTTFSGSGIWASDDLRWFVQRPSDSSPQFVGVGNTFDYLTTEVGIHTVEMVMSHTVPPCIWDEPLITLSPIRFEVFALPIINPFDEVDATDCLTDDGEFKVHIESTDTYTIQVTDQPDQNGVSAGDYPYTGLSSGIYTVTVTNEDQNGCSDNFVVNIDTVNPTFSIVPTPLTADCDGTGGGIEYDVIDISGVTTPFDPVLINSLSGTRTTLASSNMLLDNLISPVNVGTYYIEVTDNNNCTETSLEVSVVTDELVALEIENFVFSCDETVDIPYVVVGGTNVSVTSSPGGLFTLSEGILTVASSGEYTVVATDPSNSSTCMHTELVSVVFYEETPSPLDDSYIICPLETAVELKEVTLDAGIAYRNVEWLYEDSTPIPASDANYEISGSSIIIKAPGIIIGEFENYFGCITTQPITIIEDCLARIVTPNAFKPLSGVSANQNFSIYSLFLDIDQFEVFIYNRWGEIVFQSVDVDFQWNGGYNNSLSKPLPLGTYAYILKYVDTNDKSQKQQEQRGGVLLIR